MLANVSENDPNVKKYDLQVLTIRARPVGLA